MPRPGPRPYECVRRAWHSDRHHPVRGSLIQEIFRIVNEVHCPATRKNREWQEKLPIVVLKAEEIMYSKANSEAEYSNLETLWDRVNDAINTIIRRDESTETGELLQPCIEAALHLGCTPRRSSRSERNNSPRHYLRPEGVENSNNKVYGNHAVISSSPLMLPYRQYSMLDPMNPLHHSNLIINSNHVKKFPVLPKKFCPSNNHRASEQTCASSNTWSVYPLCYNNQIRSHEPSTSNSHLVQSEKLGLKKNLPPLKILDVSDNNIIPSRQGLNSSEGHGKECDLTLRLGSYGGSIQIENGNRSSLQGKKFLEKQGE
ncbi:hypothetical protein ABFS83_01G004000 [Erythranthe nasuta]